MTHVAGIISGNTMIPAGQLPVVTGWNSFTPTWETDPNQLNHSEDLLWRRVGDSMEISGIVFTNQTTAPTNANAIAFRIPNEFNVGVSGSAGQTQIKSFGTNGSLGSATVCPVTTNIRFYWDGATRYSDTPLTGGDRDLKWSDVSAINAYFTFHISLRIPDWADNGITGATDASLYIESASATKSGLVKSGGDIVCDINASTGVVVTPTQTIMDSHTIVTAGKYHVTANYTVSNINDASVGSRYVGAFLFVNTGFICDSYTHLSSEHAVNSSYCNVTVTTVVDLEVGDDVIAKVSADNATGDLEIYKSQFVITPIPVVT